MQLQTKLPKMLSHQNGRCIFQVQLNFIHLFMQKLLLHFVTNFMFIMGKNQNHYGSIWQGSYIIKPYSWLIYNQLLSFLSLINLALVLEPSIFYRQSSEILGNSYYKGPSINDVTFGLLNRPTPPPPSLLVTFWLTPPSPPKVTSFMDSP